MKQLVKYVVIITALKVGLNFYHKNWYFDKNDNFVDVMNPKSSTIVQKTFEKLNKRTGSGELLETIIRRKVGSSRKLVILRTTQKSDKEGFYLAEISKYENVQQKFLNHDLITSDEIKEVDMSNVSEVGEGLVYIGKRDGENIKAIITQEQIGAIFQYLSLKAGMLGLNFNKAPTNGELMEIIEKRPWYSLSYDWVATLFTNKLDYYSDLMVNAIIDDWFNSKKENE